MSSIDVRQVRILARYALTSEWRMASMGAAGRRRKMSRGWAYWQIVIFLMIGAFSIRLFVSNATGEAYVTATAIFMLYSAFIVASNIFMSFGTGFLSPDEARIISLHPVSSDSFFFSRLVVLIAYTAAISFLLSIGPCIALEFFIRDGSWPILLLQTLLFLLAIMLSGITSAMAIVTLYGVLMSKMDRSKLAKITGYVQFIGSFATAMSFIVLSQIEHRIDLHQVTLSTMPWIAAIPSYWFASLGVLGTGINSGFSIVLALAAIVSLVVLSAVSYNLLGKKYQTELEDLSTSASAFAKRKKTKPDSIVYRLFTRFARSDEARAIFQVLRAQFRYDTKFRMQFLSSLPITVLYLVVAVLRGGIVDPFTRDWRHIIGANMFYLIAMLMPLISMQAISQSENFKAAWIFFTSPIDRAKLLLAVRNMMLISIVIPYMIAMAVIFSYYMSVVHAVENTLVLAGLAGIIFQLYLMISPKMPFAQQRRPNRGGFAAMFGISSLAILALVLFGVALYFGYESQARYWPMLAILVTLSAALEAIVHRRIRNKLDDEEFEM